MTRLVQLSLFIAGLVLAATIVVGDATQVTAKALSKHPISTGPGHSTYTTINCSCQGFNATHPFIYAADTLPNGTIRLYSGNNVWELSLFEVNGPEADDMAIFEHEGRKYGTVAFKAKNVRSHHFYPHGDGVGFKGASISLGHSFATNVHQPSKANENSQHGTFLFEVPEHYHHWYNDNVDTYRLGRLHDEKFGIQAAFVLHFEGRQVMFVDLGGELYLQEVPMAGPGHEAKLVKDEANNYAVGRIPPCLSAAFTVEFPKRTFSSWVVLIKCVEFCVIPFVDGKIRFDKCKMSSIDNLMHLSQRFEFSVVWEQHTTRREVSTASNDRHSFVLVTDINGLNTTLIEKSYTGGGTTWRLFHIDIDIIFYSLLLALLLLTVFFCITFKVGNYFRAGKSYEVAKTEAMDMKRELHRVSKWVADSEGSNQASVVQLG